MPSFTTPARVRFPRSNIAGRAPDFLAPGSPAFNWPDRKIFVGDPGGVPLLFSQLIREWQLGAAYAPGDIVIHDGEILIARVPVPPDEPFDPNDWQALTSNQVSRFGEPVGSGLIIGGAISNTGPSSINVAAGRGVVADTSAPSAPVFTLVEWAAFTAPVPAVPSSARLLVGIDASGTLLMLDSLTLQPDVRRDLIVLGTVRVVDGSVSSIGNQPLVAGSTAETYRDEMLVGRRAGWRIQGASLIPDPAANLRVAVTAGIVFAPGNRFSTTPDSPNIFEFAGSVLPLTTYDRGDTAVAPADNLVKAGFWDNGGVVQPVPADQFTIQFLILVITGTTAQAQLGQTLYPSAGAALAKLNLAYEQHAMAVRMQGAPPFGAVIVRGNATNLTDPAQALLVPALLGRTSPYTFHVPPSAAEDLSVYYRLDGTRTLTGNMNAGGFRIDNAIIDGGTY